ncbi:hypothetical protein NCC49_005840 [Naganishia albida]|nr:hypothetical protein NCC49_005840 [Naganishia albida]
MPRRTNPSNNATLKSQPKRKIHHPPSGAAPAPPAAVLPIHKQPYLPIERSLLESLAATLDRALADPNLAVKIQQIKALLYEKRFLEVFEREQWLDIYAARWVPSRALAFREIFTDVGLFERQEEMATFLGIGGKGKAKQVETDLSAAVSAVSLDKEPAQNVLCIGGGAGSELVALAGIVADSLNKNNGSTSLPTLDVHLLDIGPYGPLIERFQAETVYRLVAPSTESVTAAFHQIDILSPTAIPLLQSLLKPRAAACPPPIITLLFTLTELFLQSRPATIALLTTLTRLAPRGTLFLVVDAANEEASAVTVGKEGRSWSLGTVMDGVLSAPPPRQEGEEPAERPRASWRKLEAEDSKWFRLREGLQEHYPVKLENTRYWLRLYRRN